MAQGNAARRPIPKLVGGADRTQGEAQLARYDISGTARQNAQGYVAHRQTIHDFVNGPIAAAGEDDVRTLGHGVPRQVVGHGRAGRGGQLDVQTCLAQHCRGLADFALAPARAPPRHRIVDQNALLQLGFWICDFGLEMTTARQAMGTSAALNPKSEI